MKSNKANLSFLVTHFKGGTKQAGVTLQITDETSHVQFLKQDLTYEEFGLLFSSARVTPKDDGEIFGLTYIGKKIETKTVDVVLAYDASQLDVDTALNPFISEGWLSRDKEKREVLNHHRKTKTGYSVNFYRYVDK